MTVAFDRLGLVGRLGNSLFQLASTLGIASLRGDTARFNADWIHRPYFAVPDELFGDCAGGTPLEECVPWINHIDPRVRVYAQDVSLFADIMPTIREYLQPSALARVVIADGDQEFRALPRPIVGIHVRRGDNIVDPGVPNKSDYHRTPPLGWYERAYKTLADGAASVFVASDDPDWCEQHLGFADLIHRGTGRPKEHEVDYLTAPILDVIELDMLRRCDRLVVSGSTYGIWGATGVALTALLSAAVFGEDLTPTMVVGLGVIIAGVLLVELGSQRAHRVRESALLDAAGEPA